MYLKCNLYISKELGGNLMKFKKIGSIVLAATVATASISGTSLLGGSQAIAQTQVSDDTLGELWSSKDFEVANIAISYIDSYKDADGNLILEISDKAGLAKALNDVNADFTADELEDAIDNFNKIIIEENGSGVLTDFNNDINGQLEDLDATQTGDNMTRKITCSNALGAISLIHAGSYSAAAALLGISGGLSVGIPLIISTAYYLGSLLC